ncbi:sugar porter family MFS transporter [Citrobacter sp. JGM124]|uniref:sugar porter family MFS transporter n=1 Tax=Citrobacter sp. JGM124 TaxID=2799789 RepID=UPI001BA907F5|nr:sugar porter family MFS transporter [Citrobacter sp. JGM124]MBS0847822.1 sugar porter family MFS transporter [Citrobacter sp. JGM124]
MSYEQKFNAWYVYMLCCSAALGGIMFGYSTGVIAGAVGSIQSAFGLTPSEVGWAASSIIVGAVIGALTAGAIGDKLGRKRALLVSAIIFIVTSWLSATTPSFTVFNLARIACGFAVGLAGTVAPMYMSEISPAKIRGKASGIYNLSTVTGQLIVFIVNFFVAKGMTEAWMNDEGWRMMIGLQIVPSIIMLLLTLFLPESPYWCIKNQRSTDAVKVLKRIYPEFNEAEASILFNRPVPRTDESSALKSSPVKSSPVMKYILVVGILIAVLQQFTGINVMNYYAPLVLQNESTTQDTILFQTIFIALFNGIGGLIGMNLFDRYGRLPVMKIGTIGSILGLLIASWGMYTHDSGYITIFGILFFMLLFAMGWGAGAWVLISEIFPEKIRGIGMSLAVSLMWVANFLITLLFPIVNDNTWLQANFNGAFSMWIFVVFNIICYIFLSKYVPETKGVALADIERVAAEKMHKKSGDLVNYAEK